MTTTSSERLSDAEALMWRLGAHDARLRPTITVVAVLDGSPGVDLVMRRAAGMVRAAPRFGARVVPSPSPLSPPRLIAEDRLDLSAHVRVVGAPGEGTVDDVLAMAGPLAADGVDPARPLWQLTLVEGMRGGGAALIVRMHHCLTDGVGALALATSLFDPGDAPAEARRATTPGGLGASFDDLVGDLRHEAGIGLGVLRRAVPAVAGLLGTGGAGRSAELLGVLRSAAAALSLDAAPSSPLLAARSASVVLGAVQLDLDAARRAGRRVGATVNDVFVTAVLEGVRRYHAKRGSHPDTVRLAVPLDLRGGGGGDGNNFFPARFDAPLGSGDVDGQLQVVHRLVAHARTDPALAAFDALAAVAARLPAAEALVARALAAVDVIASNVAGPPDGLALGGRRVLRLLPFGPRSGAACNVTTVSQGGTLHIGVNLDPAAVDEPETFLDCLGAALADTVPDR